ncbi:hypothetical protein PMG11_09390 [Penicillium brasilianum]|uniref:BTB domain-containing protein n=1 Tax=Penicillium brasilianum TaxID=104259 RepID=A0A0F7TVR5_PENBI|nr:hypothetical protein PMG11_09390 [Penicillium brasilianum]
MDDTPTVEVSGTDRVDLQNGANNASNEVEMTGTQETSIPQTESAGSTEPTARAGGDIILLDAQTEPEPPTPAKKIAPFKFLDFLTSPIVEIVVGEGDQQTVLTAHQTLLLESPFLSEFVGKFESSGPRRIELPGEDVDAFGCFLQFEYTRDYTITQPEDPSISDEPERVIDTTGDELLRHARIYTLAEKLGLPQLKSLAHTKIHRVNGTPRGELSYARYVYTHTSSEDTTIRKPVASYWASRGHLLRHDVQGDWDSMCLEVPEFTTDVLKILMDRKEKSGPAEAESTPRGRKRLRASEK